MIVIGGLLHLLPVVLLLLYSAVCVISVGRFNTYSCLNEIDRELGCLRLFRSSLIMCFPGSDYMRICLVICCFTFVGLVGHSVEMEGDIPGVCKNSVTTDRIVEAQDTFKFCVPVARIHHQ